MNFFLSQETSRKKTKILVFYFVVCVLILLAAVYLAIFGFGTYLAIQEVPLDWKVWWQPDFFIPTALVTLGFITCGSLYKVSSLAHGGGKKVAELVGGKLLPSNTKNLKERQLLNVVEEMSIASGTPVPSVYLLDESSINAFAAGFSPKDAVVGVTKGTIENLNRDELQGVIAHEFSHIFNGDMRLNIRLMGIVHGILIIALVGSLLMRTRGRRNPLPLLGLILLVIGYAGVFFGKLIKAAISREREFLADASAVQFTRNPDGIGGALKKIGSLAAGSRIQNPKAEEASHFYFANGLRPAFLNALATHPPLEERIKRIEPMFDGKFASPSKIRAEAPQGRINIDPQKVASRVGAMPPENLIYAAAMLSGFSETLQSKIHDPVGACNVIYALLAKEDFQGLKPEARLPLVELAIPALKSLSPSEYEAFRRRVKELSGADKKIDLFEFVLEQILIKNLDPHFGKTKKGGKEVSTMATVKKECEALLLAVEAFARHEKQNEINLDALSGALEKLSRARPKLKEEILKQLVAAIQSDGTVSFEEAEFLRGICMALELPLPPFVTEA